MRVGVVAGELGSRSTGVGRYLSGLLYGLARWDHGVEWHLFLKGASRDHPAWHQPWVHPHLSEFAGHPVVWEQVVLPRQLRRQPLDLLFCPAYSVPLGAPVPAVVTIHDLSFELLPEEFGWRERWRRRLLARRAARVARRVLTDSPRVAEEIQRLYGVPRERVGVVPLGVDQALLGAPTGDDGVLAALGVRRPYLLSVGTVLERRLPRLLLETARAAFEARPDLQLVVAGDNRLRKPQRLARWIGELGIGDRVRLLGWVPDRVLPDLYRGAELTFYLSRYEGFGIPPLESLAFGTPAVVGPGLVLDQIWPDYPFRAESFEPAEIVRVARQVLDDREAASTVAAAAPAVLAAWDWESSSRLLVRELERAIAP